MKNRKSNKRYPLVNKPTKDGLDLFKQSLEEWHKNRPFSVKEYVESNADLVLRCVAHGYGPDDLQEHFKVLGTDVSLRQCAEILATLKTGRKRPASSKSA